MNLIDRYLNAVAAQLPRDERDDIVAELRDLILSRFEAREEELARSLTEAEQLEILRQIGHPLVVAARYRQGPEALVGPALYPWWLFAVKMGLALLVLVAVVSAVAQVVIGEIDVSTAMARAFHDLLGGALTLIGVATVAGFILERQTTKPAFFEKWRVEDLSLFEMARFDSEPVERAVGKARERAHRTGALGVSPTGRALASAAWTVVFLLWWTAALDIGGVTPRDMGAVIDGIDYRPIVRSVVDALYWPVVAYLAVRILFDLTRSWRPGDVRFVAASDFTFAALRMAGLVWLWQASALSPVIRVFGLDGLTDRIRDLFDGGLAVPALLTVIVAMMTIEAGWTMATSLYRVIAGRR